MSARYKLNTAYFSGAVLAAAAAGWLTGSWLVFAVVLAALLVLASATHHIR
jgi:hypothetical protein